MLPKYRNFYPLEAKGKHTMLPKYKTFYIETTNDICEEELKHKLKAAGINTEQTRTVTSLHDGYVLTNLLAEGIWNYETGYDECDESCKEKGSKHVAWSGLTEEQQDEFVKHYTQFIENSRQDCLLPDLLLEDNNLFEAVLLRNRHDDNKMNNDRSKEVTEILASATS